jgi:hypothetical protein
MREVEFKVCNAILRNGGNKGFRRDEKKPKLTVSSENGVSTISKPWVGLAGCICLGIAMRKVYASGRAGMENADIKALVARGKWRKQGI